MFFGQSSYKAYQRNKKSWKDKIIRSLPKDLPDDPIERVEIEIHYIFPDKRRRDLDNYSGKFLLDPLVEQQVIKDDNYNCLCRLSLSAECKPKIKKTIIEVKEIEQTNS